MNEIYDVVIIGCGPAGLSASINAKIRNKKLLLLGVELCSPKLHKTPIIYNYPGLPNIKGEDLRQSLIRHVESMGIEITKKKADGVYSLGEEFNILCGNETIRSKTCIIATGISYGNDIDGEKEFLGNGVGYCATCDAPLYKGKNVAIIGYTSEGEEEAEFLSEVCSKVYYIPMYKFSSKLKGNIEIINEIPLKIIGNKHASGILFNNSTLNVDGVFLIKETAPMEQLVPGLELYEKHIKVNRNMETNIPGLYAAGDCAGKPYQLAKAVGEGQIAALSAVSYIDKMKH
ncbi:thioredoxin reductase [Fervidicella metallireducens AeB]|uniref:Thioredoxin reductase n=1 Tax=Fervidicella metallireducens AeB TaxID=1403537 RepID=A0A017RXN7_9CLOT|nr:NAD(P)/FAD-dependent oxidoreductase [Fervidicella metallireducens]EYE89159.1 thioredoxin reductase [Fervidicella metallireducens AeB]